MPDIINHAILDGMAVVGTFYFWDEHTNREYVAVGHVVAGATDDPDEMYFRNVTFYDRKHGQQMVNLSASLFEEKGEDAWVEFHAEDYTSLSEENPFSEEVYIPAKLVRNAFVYRLDSDEVQGWSKD